MSERLGMTWVSNRPRSSKTLWLHLATRTRRSSPGNHCWVRRPSIPALVHLTPLRWILYFAVAETSIEEALIPAAFTARMTK